MKFPKFSDEQIAYAVRQVELGSPIGRVCREVGVSESGLYRWRKRFKNLGLIEIRELRRDGKRTAKKVSSRNASNGFGAKRSCQIGAIDVNDAAPETG